MSKIVRPEPENDGERVELEPVDAKALSEATALRRALTVYLDSHYDMEEVRRSMSLHSVEQAEIMVDAAARQFLSSLGQSADVAVARHRMRLAQAESLVVEEMERGNLGVIPILLKIQERDAKQRGTDAAPKDSSRPSVNIVIDNRLPHQRSDEFEQVQIDVTPEQWTEDA